MVEQQLDFPDRRWDIAFGAQDDCALEDRVRKSNRIFVRSLDHLAFHSEGATGQKLTGCEVLQNFGIEKIAEVLEYGSAILVSDSARPAVQPGERIRKRLTTLGLSPSDLADKLGMSEDDIVMLENGSARLPARILARVCSLLALDEYRIGLVDPSARNHALGVRFRNLRNGPGGDGVQLTKSSTLSLLEDAWVIARQDGLQRALRQDSPLRSRFAPDSDYGHAQHPAWRVGYELASKTHQILGLGPEAPIDNLRSLIEDRLGVPLVQDKLSQNIAGATLQSGNARGIVVNIASKHFNTWSSRLTISHELGHLLWDPDNRLDALVVDTNDRLDEPP